MLDKEQIRLLAQAEREMDEGKVPFVWMMSNSGNYERLAVAPSIMEDLNLIQGQTINTIIMDAIARESLKILGEKLDEIRQSVEDSQLTDDFDFREELKDGNNTTNS